MNNYILKIKNVLNKIHDFFKINPHKHWVFLLYVFFILTSVLILFSFYLLYQIKNENVFQVKVEPDEKLNLLKEDLLKKVLSEAERKEAVTNDIKNNIIQYKDPSL